MLLNSQTIEVTDKQISDAAFEVLKESLHLLLLAINLQLLVFKSMYANTKTANDEIIIGGIMRLGTLRNWLKISMN